MELVRRMFKVQSGEGSKVFLFVALSALLQMGVAVGMSAADSLFLVQVGAASLPYIYLLMPLVMLVHTSVTAFLMSRIGIDRVFDLTLAFVVVGGIGAYCLLQTHHIAAYYLVKLYVGLWFIGLYTLFWNFADSYFDIQDAKRLFPLFTGGAAAGAVVGGLLVGVATRHAHVDMLFLAWAAIALATAPLVFLLRGRCAKIEVEEEDESRSFLQEIRVTVGTIGRSRYAGLLVAGMFTALVLTTLLEFQYASIFERGRSEQQLAALLGSLYAWVNVFNLVVNFFLFNRLVLRVGVGNVAVITPVIYLVTFLALLFNHGFAAGVLGFFAYQGILTSIDWNNTNFLFNAVPSAVKKQVRTVAEGLCEPLASATAGIFLLLFGTRQGYLWLARRPDHGAADVSMLSPEGIAAIGVGVGALYLSIAAVLRGRYLQSMVANLKQEWLNFASSAERSLAGLDRDQIAWLDARAEDASPEVMATAIRALWQNDRRLAVERVMEACTTGNAARQEAARALLAMMLAEGDQEVIRRLLDWRQRTKEEADGPRLEQPSHHRGAELLTELGHQGLIAPREVAHLLDSREPLERAAAAVIAWNSACIGERHAALGVVSELLAGEGDERVAAFRALGRSRQERSAFALAAYLEDSDPRIRSEALDALARLVTRESTRLVPRIVRAIERGSAEDRQRGMQALARIGDVECVAPLLAASATFTPFEQRQAETVLRAIGPKSVPTTVAILRDPRAPYWARAVAARALAWNAFPQLEALSPGLIHAELMRAYETMDAQRIIEAASVAGGGHGLHVLARFYGDRKATAVDFVLEILTLGGRLPAFELVAARLRSGSRRDRANALEAIEQGVSRSVFRLLRPLVDGSDGAKRTLAPGAKHRVASSVLPERLRRALASPDPLESAAAAQALWETGGESEIDLLRERLHDDPSPLLRETLFALLIRATESAAAGPIETLAALARAPFFAEIAMEELAVIARHAIPTSWAPGSRLYEAGDPADRLFVVTEGDRRYSPGDTFGEEGLFGSDVRTESMVSGGIRALAIPNAALLQACETYPRVAIALLRQRATRAALGAGVAGWEPGAGEPPPSPARDPHLLTHAGGASHAA